MRCVIPAAGISLRLRPLTENLPKCLLKVGGQAILERTVREVFHSGITDITLVTGFQGWMVEDFVRRNFPSIDINCVHNPDFARTDNAYSLLYARGAVEGDDLLLLDSDVVFDGEILRALLSAPFPDALAIRTRGTVGDEEIKVELRENKIVHIGKNIPPASAAGESIGIMKFSKASSEAFFTTLDKRIHMERHRNEFYEASIQEMIDKGFLLHAVFTAEHRCVEIDTLEDIHYAVELFGERS